jgi:eukaryotic-like serine/threonine-protein kinase
MAAMEQFIGKVLDEKYRIERQLGQGGMGAVFLATHLGTGRPVAVKLIVPQFMTNEEFVERFKREAKAAGLLRHPNVVNVTDFGFADIEEGHVAYLVMEYLKGQSLGHFLKEKGRQSSLGFIVDIVEQICLALEEAHKNGIIHRDLKPDNIWLEPDGRGRYNAKVLDFGLAKLRKAEPSIVRSKTTGSLVKLNLPNSEGKTEITKLMDDTLEVDPDASTQIAMVKAKDILVTNPVNIVGSKEPNTVPQGLTRVGSILGTPLYMSPEQCAGEELDARSDIYSLGIIIYEMLVGAPPFTGNMYQLIMKHSQESPQPIRKKRPNISKAVETVVMSAISKSPLDRPVSANALSTSLRANAESEIPLIRESFNLYSKEFSLCRRISLSIFFPFMIFLIPVALSLTSLKDLTPFIFSLINIGYGLAFFLLYLIASDLNTAAFTLVVEQKRLSPSAPIQIRPILNKFSRSQRMVKSC